MAFDFRLKTCCHRRSPFAIVASTGDIDAGLRYPVVFAAITVVVGFFFLPQTKDRGISRPPARRGRATGRR